MKEAIVKINKTKSWFWEDKQNWQDFSQIYQEKWEKNQVKKIRNEKGKVTTENDMQRIIRLLWKTICQ